MSAHDSSGFDSLSDSIVSMGSNVSSLDTSTHVSDLAVQLYKTAKHEVSRSRTPYNLCSWLMGDQGDRVLREATESFVKMSHGRLDWLYEQLLAVEMQAEFLTWSYDKQTKLDDATYYFWKLAKSGATFAPISVELPLESAVEAKFVKERMRSLYDKLTMENQSMEYRWEIGRIYRRHLPAWTRYIHNQIATLNSSKTMNEEKIGEVRQTHALYIVVSYFVLGPNTARNCCAAHMGGQN